MGKRKKKSPVNSSDATNVDIPLTVLLHRVRLFSLVPLVWESNPKLQGGWCKTELPDHRGSGARALEPTGPTPHANSFVIGTAVINNNPEAGSKRPHHVVPSLPYQFLISLCDGRLCTLCYTYSPLSPHKI